MDKKINIAIDGPAAAGKSTISRRVAEKLGYIYIDTGAMYRAVTLLYIEKGKDIIDSLEDVEITFKRGDGNRVLLNQRDVTEEIRSEAVTSKVSEISSFESVRNYLVSMQQKLGQERGVVMDGRDIGTTVLPEAELKIFMQASPRVRAARRLIEEKDRGSDIDIEQLTAQIIKRDELDMNREISPLVKAEDAVLLDTTEMTIDEAENFILEIAQNKMGEV
ncbi:(d)CMP kinase [Lacicoccus alkaliphilus]|uniref:Cytidylate kinase n=1 Tax=Lacicoccus alkaliphilus DSM 16010 TaxID=1123231 RepID=A0A1M7BBW5_9BACL|nr:(d)CMP kinase [Salinicoccus alkaliphilus]SHL52443.1 cytidylate kinase [Salinicoccus alkaliphilus DSM 16010]